MAYFYIWLSRIMRQIIKPLNRTAPINLVAEKTKSEMSTTLEREQGRTRQVKAFHELDHDERWSIRSMKTETKKYVSFARILEETLNFILMLKQKFANTGTSYWIANYYPTTWIIRSEGGHPDNSWSIEMNVCSREWKIEMNGQSKRGKCLVHIPLHAPQPKLHASQPKLHASQPKLHALQPNLHASQPNLHASKTKLRPS